MTLRAEVEDALCLVELRGFEPLTPCMPSRNPSMAPTTHPCVTGPDARAVVLPRGGSRGLVRLALLPRCCPPAIGNPPLPRRSERWRAPPCEGNAGPSHTSAAPCVAPPCRSSTALATQGHVVLHPVSRGFVSGKSLANSHRPGPPRPCAICLRPGWRMPVSPRGGSTS
jgi:hypothetical protein